MEVKARQGPFFKGSIWLNNSVIAIYIIWAVGRSENPGEGPSCNVMGMIPLGLGDSLRPPASYGPASLTATPVLEFMDTESRFHVTSYL